MERMREEFETFVTNRMKESGFLEVEVRVEMLGVSSDGSYFDGTVDAWWDFWKASRAALCVELPQRMNGLDYDTYACGFDNALYAVEIKMEVAGVKYK